MFDAVLNGCLACIASTSIAFIVPPDRLNLVMQGKQLLRHWMRTPTWDIAEVERRQEAIQLFMNDIETRQQLKSLLKQVNSCPPRDLSCVRCCSICTPLEWIQKCSHFHPQALMSIEWSIEKRGSA
jgi:hypothetical protein